MKPCPFCGAPQDWRDSEYVKSSRRIARKCKNCGATGPISEYYPGQMIEVSKSQVNIDWSRRPNNERS